MGLIDRFSAARYPNPQTRHGVSSSARPTSPATPKILPTSRTPVGRRQRRRLLRHPRAAPLFQQAGSSSATLTTERLFGTPASAPKTLARRHHRRAPPRMEQDASLDNASRARRPAVPAAPDWVDIIRTRKVGWAGSDSTEVAGYLHYPRGRTVATTEFLTPKKSRTGRDPRPARRVRGMSWLSPVIPKSTPTRPRPPTSAGSSTTAPPQQPHQKYPQAHPALVRQIATLAGRIWPDPDG